MLIALKDYLQQVGRASLTDLAYRFDVQESAIQGMMKTWVTKGYVDEISLDGGCATKSCNKGCCSAGVCQIIYQWRFDKA